MRKVLEAPENRQMYYEIDILVNAGACLGQAVVAQVLLKRMIKAPDFNEEEIMEILRLVGDLRGAAFKAMHCRKTYFDMLPRYWFMVANGMDRFLRHKTDGSLAYEKASEFLKELLAQEQKILAKGFGVQTGEPT